jgi:transposase
LETDGNVKVKQTRKRKIDPDALKKAVEEKPDSYLRELAMQFNSSTTAVHKRLVSLGYTYKKRRSPTPGSQRNAERSIAKNQKTFQKKRAPA